MKRKELASYLLFLGFIGVYVIGIFKFLVWANDVFAYAFVFLLTNLIWYLMEKRMAKNDQ